MAATDLYKSGRLADAINAQIEEVKVAPADQAKRLFLFELLAFAGGWERARRQIEAVRYDDVDLDMATQAYHSLIDSELLRRRVLKGEAQPQFLAEPPEHALLRLEAARSVAAAQYPEAGRILSQADASAPEIEGQLNERRFTGLRDCDDLFGSVLEVMTHGAYYWVPFEHIDALTLKPPRFPRDLIWIPARLEASGSAGDVFLPALYPASAEHADDEIKLGRRTDWLVAEQGPVLGVGQRTFLVNDDSIALLEWRTLQRGTGS
jgi:type VI secretion system protein ImpE